MGVLRRILATVSQTPLCDGLRLLSQPESRVRHPVKAIPVDRILLKPLLPFQEKGLSLFFPDHQHGLIEAFPRTSPCTIAAITDAIVLSQWQPG